MNESKILNVIQELAKSQGFYQRFYDSLMEMKQNETDAYEEIMDDLVAQKFSDPVGLVMYIEGN